MGVDGDDQLPFGMRPGMNDNLMQPIFREGPAKAPRRLLPIALSVAGAVAVVAGLIAYQALG